MSRRIAIYLQVTESALFFKRENIFLEWSEKKKSLYINIFSYKSGLILVEISNKAFKKRPDHKIGNLFENDKLKGFFMI